MDAELGADRRRGGSKDDKLYDHESSSEKHVDDQNAILMQTV